MLFYAKQRVGARKRLSKKNSIMRTPAGIDEMDRYARIRSRKSIPANEVNSSGRQRAFPFSGEGIPTETPLVCRLSAVPPANEAETSDRQRASGHAAGITAALTRGRWFSAFLGKAENRMRWNVGISTRIHPQPAESKQKGLTPVKHRQQALSKTGTIAAGF